jgi:hypothetical protein
VGEAATRLLTAADTFGITPVEAAFREAYAYLVETTGAPREVLGELFPGSRA